MADKHARPDAPTRGLAPWVVAGVLVVLIAAVAVVLPHVHAVSKRASDAAAANEARVTLPVDYQKAVLAGATEAANLLTYSRKSFEADYARALGGATGSLKADIAARKASTLETMTKNKIDLSANVEHSAFESATGNSVSVLVTVNGFSKNDAGVSSVATPQRVELTMIKSSGTWLASELTSIGIQ